jgi:phosphatidylglycerol:prolipoprotein diacylglycerol transferase
MKKFKSLNPMQKIMKKLKSLNPMQKIYIYASAVVLIFFLLLLIFAKTITKTDPMHNEVHIIQPVAFYLFGTEIRWYAFCIITGISLAYLFGWHTALEIGFYEQDLFDGFIYGALIGIIGAKLWYILFEWEGFASTIESFTSGEISLGQMLNQLRPGLAIHGAVFGAVIFAILYCRKRKLDLFKLGEMLLPGFLIGQIVGRWGNFFNQEAHGGPIRLTPEASRAFLEGLPIPRFIVDQMYIGGTYNHPTFLYESLWNVVGLLFILIARKRWKKYWVGDAAIVYMVWYGIGRFMIESLRTDSLYFYPFGIPIRTAQAVSVALVVAGIVLFILRRVFRFHPISYIEEAEQTKYDHHI